MLLKTTKIYLISMFLFSWILWLPSVLENFNLIDFGSNETSQIVFAFALLIGAFGPAFGAFVALKSENKSFIKHLKSCVSFKEINGLKTWGIWLGFVLLIPLFINGVSIFIGLILDFDIPESRLPSVLVYIPYLFFIMLLGGGQEEIGWRGFLQGEMLKEYSFEKTSFFIGLFWGLWHIPLWFMIWDEHYLTPFFGFLIMTISISFIYSFIFDKTNGNKLIQIIFHASNNAANALLYLLYVDKSADEQILYWLYVAINVIAALIVVFYRKYYNKLPHPKGSGLFSKELE